MMQCLLFGVHVHISSVYLMKYLGDSFLGHLATLFNWKNYVVFNEK